MNEKDLESHIGRLYANHALTESTERTWLLMQPEANVRYGTGSTHMWAEVLVGWGGTLLVHGDHGTSIFRTWDRSIEPFTLLSWCARAGVDYLAAKVVDHELAYAWDRDAAVTHLRAAVQDFKNDGCYSDHAIADAEKFIDDAPEDKHDFFEKLHSIELLREFHRIGYQPNPTIYYSRGAVRRLCDLKEIHWRRS